MAEVSVYSFLLSLVLLWSPTVEAYPDGGRGTFNEFSDLTDITSSKSQTLLTGGLIFVKLDFNDTVPKGALSMEAFNRWRYTMI